MKKTNTVKFPEKLPPSQSKIATFDTAEEAMEEARRQAAEQPRYNPAYITVSFDGGYVTADGEVHGANGVAASPRDQVAPKGSQDESPSSEVESKAGSVDVEDVETQEEPKPKTPKVKVTQPKVEGVKTKEEPSKEEEDVPESE